MRPRHAVFGTFTAIMLFAVPGPARASPECPVPSLAGLWQRASPASEQELVEIEIIHRCSEPAAQSRARRAPPEWTVRAMAKCRPRNCVWGREEAVPDKNGRLVSVYVTFSARRSLRIDRVGEVLRVDIAIDYHSDARNDEITSGVIFIRNQ